MDVFMSPSNTVSEQSTIISELKSIKEELYATRNELKEFRNEMACISSSIIVCNERIDGIENRLECLEKRLETHSINNDESLKATVDQLKADFNEREQDLLLNDIDITGIPESKGENPYHIVMLIAAKLSVKIDEQDITRAERIGPIHGSKEGENATRPIVVRLSRKTLRDDILRAARIRRGADTADMNIPGNPRKFYVNERLTKTNRQLFKKTRIAAKTSKWKFIWTREGRIYTRQNEGKPSIRIKSESDILRIFRIDQV
ncbi:uncharacterized protein LOC126779831 [Nymphalis io]|uniref:uncharacterized protein LOC126779831 n=1 Tax=Inachis io TaxID=171585 RepID=UPI002168864E|nr:uncharacterized protein LOC126779831 [Nymphalis io]